MTHFVDNDIIHKLAALDLLGEADRIFGAGPDERIVLPTARFKFLLHQRAKAEQRYGANVVPRIAALLGSASELASAMDEDDQAILNKVVGIDQGEALLFSAHHGTRNRCCSPATNGAFGRWPPLQRAPRSWLGCACASCASSRSS